MIDISQIEQDAAKVAAKVAGYDWNPVLGGEVRKQALQGIRDNFNSSANPENRSWPPRKVEGDGHPLLIETGKLMQAATGGGAGHVTRISNGELTLGVDGSKVKYAAIHNNGGKRMPKREFMGNRPQRITEIGEIIADAGLGAFTDD